MPHTAGFTERARGVYKHKVVSKRVDSGEGKIQTLVQVGTGPFLGIETKFVEMFG